MSPAVVTFLIIVNAVLVLYVFMLRRRLKIHEYWEGKLESNAILHYLLRKEQEVSNNYVKLIKEYNEKFNSINTPPDCAPGNSELQSNEKS